MCEEFYLQTLDKNVPQEGFEKKTNTKLGKQNVHKQSRVSIFSAPLEIKMLSITFLADVQRDARDRGGKLLLYI